MDVPVIMQLVFQQSKSYVLRQSAGHSSCATEERFHSAVLEQGCLRLLCTTVAYGPDSAVAFTDKVVDIPVLALRTRGASDSAIDRVQ